MKKYKSKLVGWVTEDELREIYEADKGIEDEIREWIRESDSDFVSEQMNELRHVIDFETDAWGNVFAWPNISPEECGEMATSVRGSIYSYPSATEAALTELELLAEYMRWSDPWNVPVCLENAAEKRMREICSVYAKNLKDELSWWMDAPSDDLFAGYFMDEPDRWMSIWPDAAYEFVEKRDGARIRHRKAVSVSRGVFRKSFPKRCRSAA